MSGLFGSVTIKGNRITDFAGQTATVGIPIPFGYGRFPTPGNIIAASELREKIIRRRQGKGGVKTEDYEYTCDYAIGFCEGPIYGYWTIKRDGKVVYSSDPAAPIEDQEYATKWLEKATLYYGTEDQEPDSTLEAFKGVGMVSAFKGLAYIVLENDNVTAGGGAVPQYEAVPIATPPEFYVTSKPYVAVSIESVASTVTPAGGELRRIMYEVYGPEAAEMSLTPYTGELRDVYVKREIRDDAAEFSLAPTDGLLKNVLIGAEADESAAEFSLAPTGGLMKLSLITTESENNAVEYSLTPTGGNLS